MVMGLSLKQFVSDMVPLGLTEQQIIPFIRTMNCSRDRYIEALAGTPYAGLWIHLMRTGYDWVQALLQYPEMAHACDWSMLNSYNWAYLLVVHPQFADRCDFLKFNSNNWVYLLCDAPQFIDRCDVDTLTRWEWEEIVKYQPQLSNYRKLMG
jgi:hypothetical protein